MTASNYPNVLPVTLTYEGGKVDDKRDPGGRTNQGVIQRTYDNFRTSKGLAKRDVYDMTDNERDEIYETQYWKPSSAIEQPNGLDLSVFDAAVNSGVSRAKTWLAKVATKPTLIAKIQAYADARLSFLHGLVTFGTYGRGWTSRVAGIEAKALKMAAGPAAAKATLATAASAQRVKASDKKTIVKATSAGSVLAPASHQATGGHVAITVAIVALLVIAAGVAAYLAWQHGQRATAMDAEAAK